MSDSIWVHDLSPFIFQFGENGWGLRWYGMAYLAGIVWGAWLIVRWAREQRVPLEPARVQDFATWVGVGMMVGGRLGYCTFYEPSLWTEFTPMWGVLKVWEGGMASHGGIAGLAAGAFGYAYKSKTNPLVLGDCVAATAPIGVICGRIANFINGELWGKKTDGSWGVIFPEDTLNTIQDARLQIGSQAYLTINERWQQFVSSHPDQAENTINGPLRFADTLVRGSDLYREFYLAMGDPRYPNQILAVMTEGIIPLIIGLFIHKKHRKPGLTIGVVITAYSCGRFINEFWREPDIGHPPLFGWMNKGQQLTIPMLLISVGIIIWAIRRPSKPDLYQVVK